MATPTTLLQHPRHDRQHPLELRDFRKDSITPRCDVCDWKILADGYACEECKFYAHRACAEAPPRIDSHPLHTDHPLTLNHGPLPFHCDACGEDSTFIFTSFRCYQCDFHLDIRCALLTLSDRGGTQGKTPEQIKLPLHIHTLTSFSTRNDFIGDINCVICKASVEGDGHACLRPRCKFLIHERCIQDLYYTDGTKAPRIYHRHPLKTFKGEDMGSTGCANCGSNESSGEFLGCAKCLVFYCRDCVQVPESIQFPHHPDHNLVLLINSLDDDRLQCNFCLVCLEVKLCYGCPSCEFFVDISCALPVLSYSAEGMSTKIELSWHEHPLLLCHKNKYDSHHCSYCKDISAGPMYVCEKEYCEFLLHKQCIEIKSTIIHLHHLDHPLTLCYKGDNPSCEACCKTIFQLRFSCEVCAFYLHVKCAARFPTRKHPLHEHELLHLEEAPSWKCIRCGTSTDASLFRCVPCNFNLHEACMELPQVVKSEIHWHSLTLHENYVEDDSGEYYCDKCEKSRDVRLGAYVCLQCLQRWVYHIECVLPELGKVYAENIQTSAIKRMAKRIARKSGQVRATEEKLEEVKRELDELKRELDELMKENEELIISGG